jgi:hypothetical protein
MCLPGTRRCWTNLPGTTLIHDQNSNQLRLSFTSCRVSLPALVELTVGPATQGTFIVDFSECVNSELRGGMSFSVTNAIVEQLKVLIGKP